MHSSRADYLIRHLHSTEDYDACMSLQDDIWGRGFSERVPGAILRVAQKLGGVAAGAFSPDGRLIGFVFGMTGVKESQVVHWSDMLAVREEARGQRLGEQLKVFQRDTIESMGISVMYWTADPLVSRNAHFNINTLGARPTEYVENMYGANTGSVLHGAMPTDRFVYRWDFGEAPPEPSTASDDALAPSLLRVDAAGVPHVVAVAHGEVVRIPLPTDLAVLQSEAPDRALAWRLALRAAFQSAFAQRFRVVRFVRGTENELPSYVLSSSSPS
jgi:predicted GNAT superfamily acetyltransferase